MISDNKQILPEAFMNVLNECKKPYSITEEGTKHSYVVTIGNLKYQIPEFLLTDSAEPERMKYKIEMFA